MVKGGRREGAGRPPIKGGKRHNVYLSNEVIDYLKRNGNVSQEIEKLAREKMGTTKAKVTRSTKIGYGVNTSPTQDANGYHYELPTAPQWEGTYKTVSEKMDGDNFLNSLTNTFHSRAWFVKINGVWMRVIDREQFGWQMGNLYDMRDGEYYKNEVEVEVERI